MTELRAFQIRSQLILQMNLFFKFWKVHSFSILWERRFFNKRKYLFVLQKIGSNRWFTAQPELNRRRETITTQNQLRSFLLLNYLRRGARIEIFAVFCSQDFVAQSFGFSTLWYPYSVKSDRNSWFKKF